MGKKERKKNEGKRCTIEGKKMLLFFFSIKNFKGSKTKKKL